MWMTLPLLLRCSEQSVRESRQQHAPLKCQWRCQFDVTWIFKPSMRGVVRVHGGLLLLEEGGPINGHYRFAPDQPGAVWSGLFSDPKPVALSTSQAAKLPKASPGKPKPEPLLLAAAAPKPVRGGIKKRAIDSDYKKKKRRPPPTEDVLAKRRAAALKAAVTRAQQKQKPKPHRAPVPYPRAAMLHSTGGRAPVPHRRISKMLNPTSGRNKWKNPKYRY